MVEIFEVDDINPCTDERFVRHEDYEKLRAASARLVAALRAADYVWHGADIERQTALFGARRTVEELLRD